MRVFKKKISKHSLYILKEMPIAIEIHHDIPGTSYFRDGKEIQIGCLRCLHPRCMYFTEKEIECDHVNGFPGDKSANACPVEAMIWDEVQGLPMIDTEKCINCGICVSRCPIGALYFTNGLSLMINVAHTDYTESMAPDSEIQNVHLCQIDNLLKIPRSGIMQYASDGLYETIYTKLLCLKSDFHNTVGRNLLIALGCKCSMRRIGDVYTRMDAIYSSHGGSFGAIEVEFSRNTLDASRGILEDIAVLNTRYGVHKNDNKAVVICLQLPNARQGYWQVIKDIKIVENIKIGTITVGALMFLLWNGCIFEPEGDRYYIDFDNMNLRQILCTQVGCSEIPVSDKVLGIMEPMK